jgi:hypothetical protein
MGSGWAPGRKKPFGVTCRHTQTRHTHSEGVRPDVHIRAVIRGRSHRSLAFPSLARPHATCCWDAVDLEAGSLRITRTRVLVDGHPVDSMPKTDVARRTIPLDSALSASLRAHRTRQATERLAPGPAWNDEGYVFTGELGESSPAVRTLCRS